MIIKSPLTLKELFGEVLVREPIFYNEFLPLGRQLLNRPVTVISIWLYYIQENGNNFKNNNVYGVIKQNHLQRRMEGYGSLQTVQSVVVSHFLENES